MSESRAAEQEHLREALATARGTVLDLRSHLSDLRAAQDFLRLSRESAEQRAMVALAELAASRAQCDALVAERDWLRGLHDAQEARVRELEPIARKAGTLADENSQLVSVHAELAAQRDALARRVAVLDRLMRELRWEDGPRAARAVLPVARMLRRVAARTGRRR